MMIQMENEQSRIEEVKMSAEKLKKEKTEYEQTIKILENELDQTRKDNNRERDLTIQNEELQREVEELSELNKINEKQIKLYTQELTDSRDHFLRIWNEK